jgi:hypothetical protein
MPTRIEFLKHVLPPEGVYVAVGIDGARVVQTFHNTYEELDTKLENLKDNNFNVFFALASFCNDSSRTRDNANNLKSFFLDLDCGEGDKKYPTQAEALSALSQFIKDLKLPKPTVVNSGRGVHAYWALEEAVPKDEWKLVAEALKQFCAVKGFLADPAVTSDIVRILRAPSSFNMKDKTNPLAVEILRMGTPVSFAAMRSLLGVSKDVTRAKRKLDDVTKSLIANRPSVFKDILKKSVAGVGCNQILHAVGNQTTIPEPLWRAVLSVAQVCTDRDKAIHVVSKGHPEYDPVVTDKKASDTKGPYTCATFAGINGENCIGCPNKGKITSPVSLGAGSVLEAAPEDNIITENVKVLGAVEKRTYVIPEYPFPFFRGKNGGVYVREQKETKEGVTIEEDKLVYEYDFYLVTLIEDPNNGMSALFRVHLPQDGVREFCAPLKIILAKDRFRDTLADFGVCPKGNQMENIMGYANNWVRHYQKIRKADKGRVQFGWADDDKCFIVGDREITADEVKYSPPSANTLSVVPKFRQHGTLEEWKKIASFYRRPGMELHMSVLFAGFGSPLMQFSGYQGGIVSLYSNEGGTGKTTTLRMVNSIFGHPDEVMLILQDTVNARISRIGMMRNISPTTDEVTNEVPEALSNYIYAMLHGRGKNRLKGSENAERVNNTVWNSISIVTGNAAITDKLYSIKSAPDGELSRIMEFPFPKSRGVPKEESDAVFKPLLTNYGVAGDVYIQYILNNIPRMHNVYDTIQKKIDKAAGLEQRERFISATAAGIMTGGILAKEAGVLDITDDDIKRVYDFLVAALSDMKIKAAENIVDPSAMLGAFISEYVNDILIINDGINATSNLPSAPIKEPRNKLLMRYEPDTKNLYINLSKFREFCTIRQVAFASVTSALTRQNLYVDTVKKRMGKGTHISANERAIMLQNIDELFILEGGASGKDPQHTGDNKLEQA